MFKYRHAILDKKPKKLLYGNIAVTTNTARQYTKDRRYQRYHINLGLVVGKHLFKLEIGRKTTYQELIAMTENEDNVTVQSNFTLYVPAEESNND